MDTLELLLLIEETQTYSLGNGDIETILDDLRKQDITNLFSVIIELSK